MTTGQLPDLSVLITAGNHRERVANALASVLTQKIADRLEAIVLECGDAHNPPLQGSDRSNVKTVHFAKGVSAGQVRAAAVRMARAPFVAFLEEHAAVAPGWAEAILAAFAKDEWAAVGPEIVNGNQKCGVSDVLSLGFYPLYEMNPMRQEETWLPFHNSAYRRDTIMKYDQELEILFALEILLQWRLRRDGHHLLLDPAMKVIHYYETDILAVWRANRNASQVFAANWSKLYSWSTGRRIIRILSTPVMPLVRSLKLLRILFKRRPDQLGRFVKGLPVMLLSHSADATGEFLGLLFGAGAADIRYLDHSVNAPRRLPSDFPHFSLD
jgi:glycosyltransferase involved in cell wall biosynthesis